MNQSLMVLVVIAAFLAPSEGQDAYDQLSNMEKKGVDLALENLNSHSSTQYHFRFFRSLKKFSTESGFGAWFIYHNFYAKATTCTKGTEEPNAKWCTFRNDKPLIECAVCYKIHSDNILSEPKPYISCVRKPSLTEDVQKKREEHCNKMQYSVGTISLLGSTGRE
uniref:Retinoic acid receptor responder protein 2 n=1 Tax=Paramormyrops kingsleyae TaxID=1676925 RepID=A0A3B3RKR2_9TELE